METQTTLSFDLEKPYTILSDGKKLTLSLQQDAVEPVYEYHAVLKLEEAAYLRALMPNWSKYQLISGEVNLFLEDTYVGRMVLSTEALSDTLDISMGQDPSITIKRERVDQFTKRQFIGNKKVETRSIAISCRNQKAAKIKIRITDQIPISTNNDTEVLLNQLSKGKLDPATGLITWDLDIPPQHQEEILLEYEVKYPKKSRNILGY